MNKEFSLQASAFSACKSDEVPFFQEGDLEGEYILFDLLKRLRDQMVSDRI